jgi:hypothetical protein
MRRARQQRARQEQKELPCEILQGGRCPFRVQRRNTHSEQMFSGLPLEADIRRAGWNVRVVPQADNASSALPLQRKAMC